MEQKIAAELESHGLLATPQQPEPRVPEYNDLAKLTYLSCVVKESMRMHTVSVGTCNSECCRVCSKHKSCTLVTEYVSTVSLSPAATGAYLSYTGGYIALAKVHAYFAGSVYCNLPYMLHTYPVEGSRPHPPHSLALALLPFSSVFSAPTPSAPTPTPTPLIVTCQSTVSVLAFPPSPNMPCPTSQTAPHHKLSLTLKPLLISFVFHLPSVLFP